MKLRSRTGFSVQTNLRPDELLKSARDVAERFKADDASVAEVQIELADTSTMSVTIVIAAPNYAAADSVTEKLSSALQSRLTHESQPVGIQARETELAPA